MTEFGGQSFNGLAMWGPYAGLYSLKKPVDLILLNSLNSNENGISNPAERMVSQRNKRGLVPLLAQRGRRSRSGQSRAVQTLARIKEDASRKRKEGHCARITFELRQLGPVKRLVKNWLLGCIACIELRILTSGIRSAAAKLLP